MEAAVGLVGGFLLSLLLWWVLAHVVVPTVGFSNALSKVTLSNGAVIYRVKFENTGRREIIDLSIRARVHLPGVSRSRQAARKTTTILEIPLDVTHLFVLRPGRNRIVWLELDRLADRYRDLLPPDVATRLADRKDEALEGLLALSDRSYFVVQMLAFDAVSGARKYFSSPHYTAADMAFGRFARLDLVADVRGGGGRQRSGARGISPGSISS